MWAAKSFVTAKLWFTVSWMAANIRGCFNDVLLEDVVFIENIYRGGTGMCVNKKC